MYRSSEIVGTVSICLKLVCSAILKIHKLLCFSVNDGYRNR
jgi:hypothetical protein